jgi:hypothetical protein
MKKLLFLSLTSLLLAGILQANPVDVEQAKKLGVKFMNINTSVKSSVAELAYTEVTDNGQPCFYVFSLHPKGFVIVSADDRMRPILGYSTESNFTAQLPDGLRSFFENYKAGFVQMVENGEVRTEQAVADWTRLAETGKLNDERINRGVAPLLASIWNQTDLYNNMAPEDATSVYSGHCKSGCVANAMSQIMRYWEWPRHGQGGHGYDANTQYGNYGWQEANFENATYYFELMPDFLDFASPQAEVDAVALLEYHAGVSVDMMYGPNASGAYSGNVGPAMQEYFRYSPDWDYRDKPNGSNTQWENQLRSNLDGGMPLYYASSGDAGGHAYVLDGYDANNMFHLNWGWGGFDNGYYAIDGFYLTFYSFPWWHNAVFNLHPADEYYHAPEAVTLEIDDSDAINRHLELWITPSYLTRGGDPIEKLDSVVIMRDGEVVKCFHDIAQEQLWYRNELDNNGTYYYTVYSVNEAGMSNVVRDTITVGGTCDLRFELVDSGNNGWDMSFIALLDEDGKVSQRVGLWDGGQASLQVPVPSGQRATLFWTYDNTCYTHGSLEEVSYEVYDWDDNLIVASDGYPEVGDIIDYMIDCGVDCHAPYIERAYYHYWSDDDYSATVDYYWTGTDFVCYNLYRDGILIRTIDNPYQYQVIDPNPPVGTRSYGVTVSYERDGETCESEMATVEVAVTSVGESLSGVALYPNPASDSFTVEGNVQEINVFNAIGQLVYHGSEKVVEVNNWPEGVYFVRIVEENGAVSTVKFLKGN